MTVVIIVVVASLFAVMGVYGLIAPRALMAPFGTVAESPDARNEVRAVYGGFGLAVAGTLVLAAANTGGLRSGLLLAIAIALAGMAAGRVVSFLIERPHRFYPTGFYLLVEIALAAALLAAR